MNNSYNSESKDSVIIDDVISLALLNFDFQNVIAQFVVSAIRLPIDYVQAVI